MIHEFAVDPGLFCNFEQVRYLAEKFGFQQGRLISRYPKKWERMVYDALVKSVTDVQRARIEIQLQKIKNEKMIFREKDWEVDLDWLQNAEAAHARRPFHAILANGNPRNHSAVLPYEDLTEETPLWAIPSQRIVNRQAVEMADALAPVFRIAKRLVFVDPYFVDYKARAIAAMKAYLSQCAAISPYPQIEIHTHYKPENNLFQSKCQELASSIPSGKILTMICWGKNGAGSGQNDGLHNRYVLTDRGGVSFGWGLDEGSKGQTDDVVILARDVYEHRWAQYCGDTPAFEEKLKFSIAGCKR